MDAGNGSKMSGVLATLQARRRLIHGVLRLCGIVRFRRRFPLAFTAFHVLIALNTSVEHHAALRAQIACKKSIHNCEFSSENKENAGNALFGLGSIRHAGFACLIFDVGQVVGEQRQSSHESEPIARVNLFEFFPAARPFLLELIVFSKLPSFFYSPSNAWQAAREIRTAFALHFACAVMNGFAIHPEGELRFASHNEFIVNR